MFCHSYSSVFLKSLLSFILSLYFSLFLSLSHSLLSLKLLFLSSPPTVFLSYPSAVSSQYFCWTANICCCVIMACVGWRAVNALLLELTHTDTLSFEKTSNWQGCIQLTVKTFQINAVLLNFIFSIFIYFVFKKNIKQQNCFQHW